MTPEVLTLSNLFAQASIFVSEYVGVILLVVGLSVGIWASRFLMQLLRDVYRDGNGMSNAVGEMDWEMGKDTPAARAYQAWIDKYDFYIDEWSGNNTISDEELDSYGYFETTDGQVYKTSDVFPERDIELEQAYDGAYGAWKKNQSQGATFNDQRFAESENREFDRNRKFRSVNNAPYDSAYTKAWRAAADKDYA